MADRGELCLLSRHTLLNTGALEGLWEMIHDPQGERRPSPNSHPSLHARLVSLHLAALLRHRTRSFCPGPQSLSLSRGPFLVKVPTLDTSPYGSMKMFSILCAKAEKDLLLWHDQKEKCHVWP